MALEVLVDSLNKHHTPPKQFIPPKQFTPPKQFIPPFHLFDGYMLTDHSSGVQYTLRMSLHKSGEAEPVEYVANIFLPLQGAGMAGFLEAKNLDMKAVHMIINVGERADLRDFMSMYEEVCIRNGLETHLHVVIFGSEGEARSQVADLVSRHPSEPISLYEMMAGMFSHSKGYKYVADKLLADDLLVLMDHHFIFTKEFVQHVRMCAVKGHQAYFPILFSFYKPELVKQYAQKSLQMVISADSGFFLRYNYQVVAVYRSDYDEIRKVELNNTGGVAKNDDVIFVDKALSSKIYVLRALEPYLRRNYRPRTCNGLSGTAYSVCMNSKVDAIGSKKILGSLLISHDILDAV